MSESENINQVVTALRKVKPVDLLIIQLANEIPIQGGTFDPQVLTDRLGEVNLALMEVKSYGAGTLRAVESLILIQGRNAIRDGDTLGEPEEEED